MEDYRGSSALVGDEFDVEMIIRGGQNGWDAIAAQTVITYHW